MPQTTIRTSTTEAIPGETRAAKEGKVISGTGKHEAEALRALCDSAIKNNFEAIVGVRLAVVPDVRSEPSGRIWTTTICVAYGTAVSY
jgi:uncharacterized protein YbjQ (UPF0145 family)